MASMTLGGGTKYYIPKETRKLNEPIAKIEGTDLIWTAAENATSYGIKIQKMVQHQQQIKPLQN